MKAQDLFNIEGRVALITGAATGLGEQFAHTLAENGAKVVLVGRKEAALKVVVEKIAALGGQVIYALADVNDRAAMNKAFESAENAFGTVDIFVNNAGIAPPAKFLEMDENHWNEVVGTNLNAVWFNAQMAAKRMLAAHQRGAIINIASVLGFSVQKAVGAYTVSKAGVVQATKQMGLELASKGIRVNAIAPGYIVTNINRDYLLEGKGKEMLRAIPYGQFGKPEDLEGALLLLASDASRFMCGETIVVDGGHLSVLGQ